MFHAWGAIEDALVKRSRFFTLIDIYGHYANRGDTVRVEGAWYLDCKPSLLRALNFLSSSARCGASWPSPPPGRRAGPHHRSSGRVEAMREIRFDLRTSETHPIIGKGRVICTLPVPPALAARPRREPRTAERPR